MENNIYKTTLVILAGIFCFGEMQAQYPAGLKGEGLRAWLKVNLYEQQFISLGYNAARQQMYSYTDEVNDSIACIYTGFKQQAVFATFPDPINAEHLVPQSFYGSAEPMKSDLHNIRPTHMSANSARGNYPYEDTPDASAFWYGTDASGNYFSTGTQPAIDDGFSERVSSTWEPREDRKGDIARHVFYFFTVYPFEIGDFATVADINILYSWHLADPADALEIQRNDRVEAVQGNRNPYVDHIELVELAWFATDVPGCVYPDASNYDAEATMDDGSCIFSGLCPSDLNADGEVSTADLLILLGDYGAACE